MIRARKKVQTTVMALCLGITLLMPILGTNIPARASSDYKVISNPVVITGNFARDLGAVKVTLDETAAAANSIVTVSMPSELSFSANGANGVKVYSSTAAAAAAGDTGIIIVAPGGANGLVPADFATPAGFRITSNRTFDIKMASALTTIGDNKYFFIYFNGADLNNFNGDIKVSMFPPAGSVFSQARDLVIAKTASAGATLADCKRAIDLTDIGGAIDTVSVTEQIPDTFTGNDYIKLEILSNGFSFNPTAGADSASYDWNFAGNAVINGDVEAITAGMFSQNNKLLTYPVQAGVAAVSTPGKISFVNLSIMVDDTKVSNGQKLEIRVSGPNVTEQTITAGTYVAYGITVQAGTGKDLTAGHAAQVTGEFYISEGAPRSLLPNGILSLALPEGCEWDNANTGSYENTTSGNIVFNNASPGYPSLSDGNRVLKWIVTTQSNTAARVKFKDFKINVSPDFTGPVNVSVRGSSGAVGTVKVAEVKPAAVLSIDSLANVQLGKANQKIDDIIISEGALKGIMANTAPGNVVSLDLDTGFSFTSLPKVEVIEGDIDIDTQSLTVNNNRLTFKINAQSARTPSKIKLSGVYLNAYRIAPEGPVNLSFTAGTNALNETGFVSESAGKIAVASCVAGGGEGSVGKFNIGSNIYEVNGVPRIMDAAPYIKAGRTYVPVRYLGYALGVTENNIVWDEVKRTVTINQAGSQVILTIGSSAIKVNGATSTMDAVPEIINGRTMLPARYVAEGLGYQAGWDPGTGTVIIFK